MSAQTRKCCKTKEACGGLQRFKYGAVSNAKTWMLHTRSTLLHPHTVSRLMSSIQYFFTLQRQ